jgi:transposase-like protein
MPNANELSPKTLQEAILYYSDEQNCIDALAAMRWPDGKPICPACEQRDHWWLKAQERWKCKECWKQFSVKINTIFEDSRLPLTKWMLALWMITNCKNGVSSWELHRAIGVTQKSAWFMLHRLRLGMQEKDGGGKLGGPGVKVEVDESFIGGKARNMHKSRRARIKAAGLRTAQTIVMGILERDGKVRTQVLGADRKGPTMHGIIRENVNVGSWLMTDEFQAYKGLEGDYAHLVINHLERYVQGNVHTQGIENFWSLLKRGLNGTYVSVEPFHLFRYVDEQAFRFNSRLDASGNKISDGERFRMALSKVAGKHITYSDLTGKERLPVVESEPF